MTVSTTASNACNAVIFLDNAVGALTDIQGSSVKLSPEFKNVTGQWEPFGAGWKYVLECGREWKVTIDVVNSTTATEAWPLVRDWWFGARGARSIRWQNPDGAAGSDQFDGECKLDTLTTDMESGKAEPTMWSVSLLGHGPLIHNIIGS